MLFIVGVQIKLEFNTLVSHLRDFNLFLQSVFVSRRTSLIMQCEVLCALKVGQITAGLQ